MSAESIAAKLEKLKREVRREWQQRNQPVRRFAKRAWRRETVAALLLALLKAFAVVALPFLVYVRASVYLYRHGAHFASRSRRSCSWTPISLSRTWPLLNRRNKAWFCAQQRRV